MTARDRQTLRRIADVLFDWLPDRVGPSVRVTAYGATAGFGRTVALARRRAVAGTVRDLCEGLTLEEAKRALMRAVWTYGRETYA